MRIKMPDGFYIAPHTHPNVERVTVISGTFLLGSGEEMNRNYTERLEPGSYTSMPPGMVHYAIAEGETVIQLTSVGPWIINYINPDEHDPRLSARQETEPFLEEKLENPGEAEIHLAVAPHGEVDPDKLPDQIKTLSGSGPFWWVAVFD